MCIKRERQSGNPPGTPGPRGPGAGGRRPARPRAREAGLAAEAALVSIRDGAVSKRAPSGSPKTSPGSSPTRAHSSMDGAGSRNQQHPPTNLNQNHHSTDYTTKVKKLVTYQGGRLESLLLPMLVTTSLMPKKPRDPPIESNMAALDISNGSNGQDGMKRRTVKREENFGFPLPGADLVSGFLKKNNPTEEILDATAINLDNVPIVIKEEPQFEDPDGDGSDGEGQRRTKYRQDRRSDYGDGANQFIKTLLHSLDCGSCDDNSCKKMQLVLGHFLACKKYSSAQGCPLCAQLIGIVGVHSRACPRRPEEPGCPVPLCDAMRMRKRASEERRWNNGAGAGGADSNVRQVEVGAE